MRGRHAGFTLIELMIVVAIVAVLVAIAYPSYREQVIKTRRAEGRAALADVAQRMERCFTRFSAYDNAACAGTAAATSEGGWYAVSATTLTATTFTLSAAPQGDQATADTRCGTLTLTHTGARGQSATPPAGYACW